MKYIDADLLRKEVKRLEKSAHKSALGCADSETRKFHEGKDFAYQHVGFLIGMLIDSLQQEQNSIQDTELTGFESALFTAFSYAWQSYLRGEEVNVVQWAKENSAELLEAARCQQEQQEEPSKSLEEEIETWIPAHISIRTDETLQANPAEIANACKEWGKCVARHFAEWGAEHLK